MNTKTKLSACCAALLFALTACAQDTVLVRSVSESEAAPHAAPCEAIVLPNTLRMPIDRKSVV